MSGNRQSARTLLDGSWLTRFADREKYECENNFDPRRVFLSRPLRHVSCSCHTIMAEVLERAKQCYDSFREIRTGQLVVSGQKE